MTDINQIKRAMSKKKKSKPARVRRKDCLSTGSTLLNLACTGWPDAGFAKGGYYFVVGDSSSGKTFLTLTCLAEATINPAFDDYRLIFDGPEDGAKMDFHKFFGSKMAERVEEPTPSATLDEWYDRQDSYIEDGRPFISILDSMDSLDSEDDLRHQKKRKLAKKKGESGTGTYGTGKSRLNSTRLRSVVAGLTKTGSILIIISQTRDNIGTFSMDPKTRSGGKALKFYATLEMWSDVLKRIRKTVKKKPRVVGVISRVKVKKNRVQGKERTVQIPIYYSVGMADIDSCINYLIDEGHWKGTESKVNAPEFEYNGSKEGLVKLIEEENALEDLQRVVTECWTEIEEACEVVRKPRYE
jgi:RecA/RadA recombinase